MPILDDFAAELVHVITWSKLTGRDAYGKPVYAAPVSYTARVDFERRNWTNAEGVVVSTRGTVVIGGTPLVQPGDRIILPDGSMPPIMDASTTDDMEGVPYYTEVAFG